MCVWYCSALKREVNAAKGALVRLLARWLA